jgi:hypothetical protein
MLQTGATGLGYEEEKGEEYHCRPDLIIVGPQSARETSFCTADLCNYGFVQRGSCVELYNKTSLIKINYKTNIFPLLR